MSLRARKIHIFPPNEQQKEKTMLVQLIKSAKEILKFHDCSIWCDIFHLKEYCFQLVLIVRIRVPIFIEIKKIRLSPPKEI